MLIFDASNGDTLTYNQMVDKGSSPNAVREVQVADRHIDDCMALVAEAGWNQVPADWGMMITHGSAFGFEDAAGHLVASAVVLPYGPVLGWISMVLVRRAWRRQGLATRLLHKAVNLHAEAGRTAVLDATPAGEQVYARLGFEPHFGFQRWRRQAGGLDKDTRLPVQMRPICDGDIDVVRAYDETVFEGDRGYVLSDIIRRDGPGVIIDNMPAFGLSRVGRIAHQIGPITADQPDAAVDLFRALSARISGPALIDIPDDKHDLRAAVASAGFVAERRLKRMVLGGKRYGDPPRMFALAGPELG